MRESCGLKLDLTDEMLINSERVICLASGGTRVISKAKIGL